MTAVLPDVVARRDDVVDVLHGEPVADPYRWLEDTDSAETAAWISAENARTEAFLSRVPQRDELRRRVTALIDHQKFGLPVERGGRFFQLRNPGLLDQAQLVVSHLPGGDGTVLIDPNDLSADGTVSLSATVPSEDGTLVAYATNVAGSDWQTWRVRRVDDGTDSSDRVEWSKFSAGSWRRDGSGFYYLAAEPPPDGAELLAETAGVRVMLHRLGTEQADDELVYAPQGPDWLPHAEVSEDGRYLVVTITRGTAPETRIVVLDLEAPQREAVVLVEGFTARTEFVANVDSTFYLLTEEAAERRRVVAVDLERLSIEHWREVVPESASMLSEVRACGGALVCHYLDDASSRLTVVGLEGTERRDVALEGIVSVASPYDEIGISGRGDQATAYFALTSFLDPGSVWSLDVAQGGATVLQRCGGGLPARRYVTERVFVTASDGASVPLFLTRAADAPRDGERPVLLYGYGGFGIPITPAYRAWWAAFVEGGGVLAVACLRGGGEYGRAWHDAGRLANKQRVFDDFCDCARFLVEQGWSHRRRIAINGASNGGLLVGACLVQHPELFGAAVPEVGVLDVLRFHRFTIGWAWKSDFGDPDDPEEYRRLRAYSPLQHVVPGRRYPATLVTTGDHDDRVVPSHSFKFAAALQAAQPAGAPPILIRVETAAGHGHGKPTSKIVAERADVLAFLHATVGGDGPRDD